MKTLNTEIIIERFVKIYGDKNDYSKVVYVKHDKKILVVCKIHKFEFLITPNNHSNGKDCSMCGKEKFVKKNICHKVCGKYFSIIEFVSINLHNLNTLCTNLFDSHLIHEFLIEI